MSGYADLPAGTGGRHDVHADVRTDVRAVVLVEGRSDQRALEELAACRGRDLAAEGVAIVAMGGVTNIGHHLRHFGPEGLDVSLGGLYDAAAEGHVARNLERAGLGSDLTGADLAALGFHVCVEDLEDELIRAHGAAGVLRLFEAAGLLASFHTFQNQPAQRGRPVERQLHRFMGCRSGGKSRFARMLVSALDPTRVPRPLDLVLGDVARQSRSAVPGPYGRSRPGPGGA